MRELQNLVGKRGTALVAVFERGRVRIDGLEFDAEAAGAMIPFGAEVEVVAVSGEGRQRVKRAH